MSKQPRVKVMKLKNVNLMATNPLKEQFAPTDAQPIRQRARMGGDPMGEANSANAASMEAAGEDNRNTIKRPMKSIPDRLLKDVADQTPGKGGLTATKEQQREAKAELVRRIAEPVR